MTQWQHAAAECEAEAPVSRCPGRHHQEQDADAEHRGLAPAHRDVARPGHHHVHHGHLHPHHHLHHTGQCWVVILHDPRYLVSVGNS